MDMGDTCVGASLMFLHFLPHLCINHSRPKCNISPLMSSTHSTFKPDADSDSVNTGLTGKDRANKPCLESSLGTAHTEHPVIPDSMSAFLPEESQPGVPNKDERFSVYPSLPIEADALPKSSYRSSDGTSHRSNSKVSCHSEGRHGPEKPITTLPLVVNTDPSGAPSTRYGKETVPLPPTEGDSKAGETSIGCYRLNYLSGDKKFGKRQSKKNASLAADEEGSEGDTNDWGKRRGWYYGDSQS